MSGHETGFICSCCLSPTFGESERPRANTFMGKHSWFVKRNVLPEGGH